MTIARDIGIRKQGLHQVASRLKPLSIQSRSILQKITNPFVMDIIGPARIDETVDRALDQNIPQMKGVQNTGVIYYNRRFS
jgi:hypothetical protein